MFLIKAFAEARSNRTGGSRNGTVSTPSAPTSEMGRRYAAGYRSQLGGTGRGRGRSATYIRPRANRGR